MNPPVPLISSAAFRTAGFGAALRLRDLPDTPNDLILGQLARASSESGLHSLLHDQTDAWIKELDVLRAAAIQLRHRLPASHDWQLVLEFEIPRSGRRADAVLLADDLILVVEFKVGEADFTAAARRQVEDYALDLADFHLLSHNRQIVPILVATAGSETPSAAGPDRETAPVRQVRCATGHTFAASLERAYLDFHRHDAERIDPAAWLASPYQPTPTIIEAAQALYARHDVREITRAEATLKNLTLTQEAIRRAVEEARGEGAKVACFVTGVPGAGKTLAGLNAVHVLADAGSPAVFLSGNGPLVKVLGEALARDECSRGPGPARIGDSRRRSRAFIQNVHRFLAHYQKREPDRAPDVRVALFDEAQRAWDLEQSARKFGRTESEPSSMLRVMDRHRDWAALIALVGGGQEINTGEAGLGEWGRAIADEFPHWRIRLAPQLVSGDTSTVGQTLFASRPAGLVVEEDEDLHLTVPTRSYRSTAVADWVNAVLEHRAADASAATASMRQFPVVVTRSLDAARTWLRERTRGNRRCGLVASSGARRLRPYGIDVKGEFDEAHWFLAGPEDVRSSHYLELAATEFQIQGLELDWVGVCWDADLRVGPSGWEPWRFSGSEWCRVRQPRRVQYALNKYRVLLTRAREGMVLWVPPGALDDPTRPPDIYDMIAKFLRDCGAGRLHQ
jgi:hypothetical protein